MQTSSSPDLQPDPALSGTAPAGTGVLSFLIAISQHIALLAAWVAMCGSLFFSEVLGWVPCTLCWYQRILMYPLAFIIAIGIFRRDRGLYLYVLPLALFGACISLYHYLLIKTTLFPPPPCTDGVSCTVDYINLYGFINIPFMALIAFLIISLMMALSVAGNDQQDQSLAATESATHALTPIAERTIIGLSVPTFGALILIFVVVSSFLLLS